MWDLLNVALKLPPNDFLNVYVVSKILKINILDHLIVFILALICSFNECCCLKAKTLGQLPYKKNTK